MLSRDFCVLPGPVFAAERTLQSGGCTLSPPPPFDPSQSGRLLAELTPPPSGAGCPPQTADAWHPA